MFVARWQIDARFGHKQAVIDLLQKWEREVGTKAGTDKMDCKILTASIGTRWGALAGGAGRGTVVGAPERGGGGAGAGGGGSGTREAGRGGGEGRGPPPAQWGAREGDWGGAPLPGAGEREWGGAPPPRGW